MATDSFWYVVYTKPQCEVKVAERLLRKNVEAWCPMNRLVARNEKRKSLEEPLFPSYVFVKVTATAHADVQKTDGVINFVHWLKQPVVIGYDEITTLRTFIRDYQDIRLERILVKPNETFLIQHGTSVDKDGIEAGVTQKWKRLAIPPIGYNLIASVEKADVQVLTSFNSRKPTGIYLDARIA